MSSSLFGNKGNGLLGSIGQLSQGNPQAVFDRMMAGNPRFRSFIKDNTGKSPQQIAEENGLDWNTVRRFL